MTLLDGISFPAVASLCVGDMALFDLANGRLYGVFPRDWAPGGVSAVLLAEGAGRVAEELKALARRPALSLAVLNRDGAVFDAALLDLLDAFDLDRLLWIRGDAQGRLYCDGSLLAPRERPVNRFTFTFQGSRRQSLDCETLPLALNVSAASPQAESWVLGLSAGTAFPESAWFQLPYPANGRLALGIVPGFDTDRWHLWLSGGERPLVARQLAGIPYRPSVEAPLRLSVVFDRTAVDLAHWGDAAGLRAMAATGGNPAVAGWNSGWRRAVADFLTTLPDDVEVDLWWFADLPGAGLDWPGTWPGPDQDVGHAGRFSPRQAARQVADLTWVPGLDLWDSLDRVINQVAERIVATPSCRHGVLIVGNSPPPPPSTSPSSVTWTRLRDAVGGNLRRDGIWDRGVSGMRERCGIACVQLPVGGAADGNPRRFQTLWRETLEQDGVRVVPADDQPIRALDEAFHYLRHHVPSSLEVRP
ncbi:MAG: hypothetical protein AB7G62_00680 [Magnetospirillum sp.]